MSFSPTLGLYGLIKNEGIEGRLTDFVVHNNLISKQMQNYRLENHQITQSACSPFIFWSTGYYQPNLPFLPISRGL